MTTIDIQSKPKFTFHKAFFAKDIHSYVNDKQSKIIESRKTNNSRPFYDRLKINLLLNEGSNVIDKKEISQMLGDLIGFKVKTKDAIMVDMVNTIFANLLEASVNKKSFSIHKMNKQINDVYGFSHTHFLFIIDKLSELGLIEQHLGSYEEHLLTVVFPTPLFANMFSGLVEFKKVKKVIVYENNKQSISFDLTNKQSSRHLSNVLIKNEYDVIANKLSLVNGMSSLSSSLPSYPIVIPLVEHQSDNPSSKQDGFLITSVDMTIPNCFIKLQYRIQFGKTIREHGRLYSSFQNTSKQTRLDWIMNGEEVVELDYSACHPTMIYDLNNVARPTDMYSITSNPEHRAFWKCIAMMCINNKSRSGAILATKNMIAKDKTLLPKDFNISDIKYYISAFLEYHKAIKPFLFKGNMELMNYDSRIALDIVYDLALQGIPCAAFHDSFIVPASAEAKLNDLMNKHWMNILNTQELPVIKKQLKEETTLPTTTQTNIDKPTDALEALAIPNVITGSSNDSQVLVEHPRAKQDIKKEKLLNFVDNAFSTLDDIWSQLDEDKCIKTRYEGQASYL